MKLVEAKESLISALSRDGQAILVHGAWGIGKSYLINEVLSEYSFSESSKNWLRVSVFNISSLDDFRDRIGIARFLKTPAQENRFKLWRPFASLLSYVPNVGKILQLFVERFTNISFHTISNSIVWIDDLERCGSSDLILKIIGEANDLVEYKKCSCIIACNSDLLEGDGNAKAAIEKLVTFSLHFERDNDEITNIGLGGHRYSNLFSQVVLKLNNNNMRIMRRISETIQGLRELLGHSESEVMAQIEVTSAIGCFVKYSPLSTINSISYLNDYGMTFDGDAYESKEHEFLRSLGYFETETIDRIVLNFVDTGIIDADHLRSEFELKAKDEVAAKARNKLQELLMYLYSDLSITDSEAAQKILDFARTHPECLHPKKWDDAFRVLKIVGTENELAEFLEIIPSEFIVKFEGKSTRAWGDKHPPLSPEIDSRIKWEEIDKDKSSLPFLLEKLTESDAWWTEDYAILAKFSPEEYVEYLVGQNRKNGAKIVSKLLGLGYESDFKSYKMKIQQTTIKAVEIVQGKKRGSLALRRLNDHISKAIEYQRSEENG